MDMQSRIEQKLLDAINPSRLKIDNDSRRHAGPATASHFRVVVVADAFEGQPRVARQQMVYACLENELADGVHALQMKCLTPDEYAAANGDVTLKAPPCGGRHRG